MITQIRPNRLEISDRFPMLSFTVSNEGGPRVAEIVLATDPSLFANAEGRTSRNFFSSRELGLLSLPAGPAVYTVPPQVLARMADASRLWFGLATADAATSSKWEVDVTPNDASPYISLNGLSNRSLGRVRMFPTRTRNNVASGAQPAAARMEWAGDTARPGTDPAAAPDGSDAPTPAPAQNGAAEPNGAATPSANAPVGDVPYDDGFGPLPAMNENGAVSDSQSPKDAASETTESEVDPAALALGVGNDRIEIKYRMFIPSPAIYNPLPFSDDFGGDGRSFSYSGGTARGEIVAHADITPGGGIDQLNTVRRSWGESTAYDSDDTIAVAGKPDWWLDKTSGATPTKRKTLSVSDSNLKIYRGAPGTTRNILAVAEHASIVTIYASGNNPLMPGSPNIDVDVSLLIRRNSSGNIEVKAYGSHDGFPAHELYVNGQRIHHYDPVAHQNGPMALMPPTDRDVDTQWTTVPALSSVSSQSLSSEIDPEQMGIEGPAMKIETPATASALALTVKEYDGVSRVMPSPAFSAGRRGTAIDRIVIHITDAPTTSSTVNWFTRADANSSAHYLVGQDGEIVQFVSEDDTAWHARGANSRSIGIEHVAVKAGGATYGSTHYPELHPSDIQYSESSALVVHLCDKYGLTPDRTTIIGHREADSGTSHTSCPDGSWDWDHFMNLVTNRMSMPRPVPATQGVPSRGLGVQAAKYTVVGGDNLSKIADKYGISFQSLRAANSQIADDDLGSLQIGQELNLPAGVPAAAPVAQAAPSSPTVGQVYFPDFLNETEGSDAQAAIIIGNAEGTRTANGGKTDAYEGHTDPGNAATNIGSFSRQGSAGMTPDQADRAQLSKLNSRLPAYLNACARANVDAYDIRLAAVWFDLFNQSETAAGRFLDQMDYLAGTGISEASLNELRFRSYVDHTTGSRFANAGGGAANIARQRHNRQPTEAEVQEVLRADQQRRTTALFAALRANGSLAAAQSLGLSAQAFGNTSSTINWDDVQLIAQPTGKSCWSTTAAMLIGWRDRMSVTPDYIAEICGKNINQGLSPSEQDNFALTHNLTSLYNQSYLPEAFRDMIEANGPIFVIAGDTSTGIHAILVTGMYNSGDQYYVRVTDPWDRVVGQPGAPGGHLPTHSTGSRYIMTWEDFQRYYERTAEHDFMQIMHSGGTHGHTPNRGEQSPPPGYAQAVSENGGKAPSPMPTARGDVVADNPFGTPTELSRQRIEKNGRSYDLAQLRGLAMPSNLLMEGDIVPSKGERIMLDDWPYIDGPTGKTQAGIAIDWAFRSGAVGDVAITPLDGQSLDGWSVHVKADLLPAGPNGEVAPIKAHVTTTFTKDGSEPEVAVTEVTLGGDGRSEIRHGADRAPLEVPQEIRAEPMPVLPGDNSTPQPMPVSRGNGAAPQPALEHA